MYSPIFSFLCLTFCFLLSGCNIPLLFWEEEGLKVVEDIVDEEEKIQRHSHNSEKEARTP